MAQRILRKSDPNSGKNESKRSAACIANWHALS
jgi:hypothetical protein